MSVRRVVIAAIVLLAAPMVLASFSGTDVFLPSVGRAPGAAGSQWYTTVWVHNPGTSPANVQFFLLERDKSNPSPLVYNDTVPAGDTKRYDNAIGTMFAVEKFGALRVVADHPVIVNGRIFSMSSGTEPKDSVGQFFAGIPATFAIASGQKTQVLGVYQTAPKVESQFRYNFGFVETAGGNVTVRVHVMDESGAELTSKDYSLAAYEVRQYAIENAYGSVNSTNLRLEMEVVAGSGKIVAFGSGLANRGNDPSTFEMSFADSLLSGGGGGGSFTLPYDGTTSSAGMAFNVKNTGGPAVQGWSSTHDGVTGLSNGGGRSGVYGKNDQANGFGVYGESSVASGIGWGMYGKVASTTGVGVGGWASSATGVTVGVWGQTEAAADLSTGVVGLARGASGKTMGVWGNALSTSGYGVYGQSGQSGAPDSTYHGGVWGDSADGRGVYGSSKNSIGVYGKSTSTARGTAGVRGEGLVGVDGFSANGPGMQAISSGVSPNTGFSYGIAAFNLCETCAADKEYAGYFSGNTHVQGTFTASTKSFRIDHPLDPANKYLQHVSVESPDMKTFYDGTVTTDANGVAVVVLPEYFSALNRDFRYQLTVIGSFAQAIVAKEIADNQFTIRTNQPSVKVSWQVTGIRHDAWANANRTPVEVEKTGLERGTYMFPDVFGMPEETKLDWVLNPDLFELVKVQRAQANNAQ